MPKNPDIELDEIANEVGERIARMSKNEEEYGRNLKRLIEILKENS